LKIKLWRNKLKKVICCLIVISGIYTNALLSQITPNGMSVNNLGSQLGDYDNGIIAAINYIVNNFYNVTIIQTSQVNHGKFNCHFFAWNNTQGYGKWSSDYLWKNGEPNQLSWVNSPVEYFTDNYSSHPNGYPSYISTTPNEAEIFVYTSNNNNNITHSARALSYTTEVISKWGSWGIYKHAPTECPDGRQYYDSVYNIWDYSESYGAITGYYKINPNYRPVGIGDPGGRNWGTVENALSGIPSNSAIVLYGQNNYSSGNITIPSGVTLYFMDGAAWTVTGSVTVNGSINTNGAYMISCNSCVFTVNGLLSGSNSQINIDKYSTLNINGTLSGASSTTISGAASSSINLSGNISGTTFNNGDYSLAGTISNSTFNNGNYSITGTTNSSNNSINVANNKSLSISGTLNGSNSTTVTSSSGSVITVSGTAYETVFTGTNWPGIRINNSGGLISYSSINGANSGITCYNSYPNIQHTNIQNTGTGINCTYASTPSIVINNDFNGNNWDVYGDANSVPSLGNSGDMGIIFSGIRDIIRYIQQIQTLPFMPAVTIGREERLLYLATL
jgi:hypothetical protein